MFARRARRSLLDRILRTNLQSRCLSSQWKLAWRYRWHASHDTYGRDALSSIGPRAHLQARARIIAANGKFGLGELGLVRVERASVGLLVFFILFCVWIN